MTATTDEPILAGDPDAQQDDPDFDVNQEIDATDIVAMAYAIEAGVPIGAAAEAHEAALATHTWTPDVACPMRSVNRKTHSLTSIYDLRHPDNEIVPPEDMAEMNWLARCETHAADLYSPTFSPAWKARNRPWTFCPECEAVFTQRYGKGALTKAVKRGTKLKTVAVAPKPEPKPRKPRAKKAKPVETDFAAEPAVGTADADAWLDAQLAQQDAANAAPTTVSDPNDAEEKVWIEWSTRLAAEAPAGGVVDWVADYHYRVFLPDARAIDVRVHGNEAAFKYTDSTGRDHYSTTLKAMLAEIG